MYWAMGSICLGHCIFIKDIIIVCYDMRDVV